MDIYVKKAIIHQFSPADTDLLLADKLLNITPKNRRIPAQENRAGLL
ncbi:Pseudouridylate synthase, 23S RNA-specific [Streptococcus sp. DD11]|nr:Pseudouridylate synthase, 23S RNA-specific [Streptococcus sp. DD11]